MADAIHLNVGGTPYVTSFATLGRLPDVTLQRLLPGLFTSQQRLFPELNTPHQRLLPGEFTPHQRLLPEHAVDAELFTPRQGVEPHNEHFIDRDGSLFRYILNYLRCNQLILPDDFKEIDALREEAVYYGLTDLINAIKQRVLRQHEMTALYVQECVFTQSGRRHPGTFTTWTITSENTSPILHLTQIGVFSNEAEVSVSDGAKKLHRSWYDDIKGGQSELGYAYAFGNPRPTIAKLDVFDEVRSLGYRLTNVSVIPDPPAINPILVAFVTLHSAKCYEFQT